MTGWVGTAHLQRALVLVTVLLAPAIAGCFAPEPAVRIGSEVRGAEGPGYADPAAETVTFTIVSRTGAREAVGLAWFPPNATTVLLVVHGVSGLKELFEGVGFEGYSLAANVTGGGRAMVVIDLPSYGETGGQPVGGIEDYALVVDQVADALRTGSYVRAGGAQPSFGRVIGLGYSMGGLVVAVSQSLHEPFEAIVSSAWSHGGLGSELRDCAVHEATGGPECPLSVTWYLENADPEVVHALENRTGTMPLSSGVSLAAWEGCVECVEPLRSLHGPAPDDVTSLVKVPVLILIGAEDRYFDRARVSEEPSHYPNAEDVEFHLLPETGHAIWWHRNAPEMQGFLTTWLGRWAG